MTEHEDVQQVECDASKSAVNSSALDHAEDDEPKTAIGRFLGALEGGVESFIFASRWFLAPVFIGLVVCLAGITIHFIIELVHVVPSIPTMSGHEITTKILALIDVALLGNLLLIVIFSGYENFVSKIGSAQGHEDRPAWMGTLDFSGLKIKIVGSVVAISLVELLADFVHIAESGLVDSEYLIWRVVLHLTFAVSGALFAVMDLIAEKRHTYMPGHGEHGESEEHDE